MRIVRLTSLTSSVIAALVTVASGLASAQIPSVSRRMGLNGPVRTVKLEVLEYSWEDSKWDPKPLGYAVARYDRNGNSLTYYIQPYSGWLGYGFALPPATAARPGRYETIRKTPGGGRWKNVWQFDKEGRLERFEAYALDQEGTSPSNWEQFSYDSQGRVEQLTYWAQWGRFPGQTEPYPPKRIKYSFDDAGRIRTWTAEDKSRSHLTYDKKGRLVKTFDEHVDGETTYIVTRTFGGYDAQGNWTVQTTTRTMRTDFRDHPQSQTVLRRWIRYYGAKKQRRS